MPTIAETIARLQAGALRGAPRSGSDRLVALSDFGTNPGTLDGWYFAPEGRTPSALVVVLHGCTQTAAAYDSGSGWSALAERHGFAVLFPEQRHANNANRCFNWFAAEDIAREGGEAASIRQMTGAVVERLGIDPAHVYVTGLSAGGAMTAVMLATYPDIFAGGAVIAGLPYGTATSMPQAFERMRGSGQLGPSVAAALVRDASPHAGRWPTLAVWHGTADRTVAERNADALIEQWRGVTGIAVAPDRSDMVDGQRHRVWLDDEGRIALEDYRIAGMGHGTPLKTRGDRAAGAAGAHMLDVGISSTWHIANGWGLLGAEAAVEHTADENSTAILPASACGMSEIQQTIEAALRSAGLMR